MPDEYQSKEKITVGQNNFFTPTNQLGSSSSLAGTELVRIYQGGKFTQSPLDVTNTTAFLSRPATVGVTLTSASVQPGRANLAIVSMTGTLGAGAALTMPTVANLVTEMGNQFVVGASWVFRVINTSSANFAWTLTTAAGWTLTGTFTIGQNTQRDFLVTLTSATAGTVQSIS
jgi:hypothetical protein